MRQPDAETIPMKWARIDWRMVYRVAHSLDWNWADLARDMGVGESNLSEVRNNHRRVSMAFAILLGHSTRLGFRMLIHPTAERHFSARDELWLTDLDDARPWPTTVGAPGNHLTRYQQHLRELRLADSLTIPPTS